VQATAYLIARTAPTDHWAIAVFAVSALHSTLGGNGGSDAWKRLSPHIGGDWNTWDRCGRLIDDYADQVKRLEDVTKLEAIRLLDELNPSAAATLAEQLRPAKSKKFNLFDPSTW
jgi:hypothetical protein